MLAFKSSVPMIEVENSGQGRYVVKVTFLCLVDGCDIRVLVSDEAENSVPQPALGGNRRGGEYSNFRAHTQIDVPIDATTPYEATFSMPARTVRRLRFFAAVPEMDSVILPQRRTGFLPHVHGHFATDSIVFDYDALVNAAHDRDGVRPDAEMEQAGAAGEAGEEVEEVDEGEEGVAAAHEQPPEHEFDINNFYLPDLTKKERTGVGNNTRTVSAELNDGEKTDIINTEIQSGNTGALYVCLLACLGQQGNADSDDSDEVKKACMDKRTPRRLAKGFNYGYQHDIEAIFNAYSRHFDENEALEQQFWDYAGTTVLDIRNQANSDAAEALLSQFGLGWQMVIALRDLMISQLNVRPDDEIAERNAAEFAAGVANGSETETARKPRQRLKRKGEHRLAVEGHGARRRLLLKNESGEAVKMPAHAHGSGRGIVANVPPPPADALTETVECPDKSIKNHKDVCVFYPDYNEVRRVFLDALKTTPLSRNADSGSALTPTNALAQVKRFDMVVTSLLSQLVSLQDFNSFKSRLRQAAQINDRPPMPDGVPASLRDLLAMTEEQVKPVVARWHPTTQAGREDAVLKNALLGWEDYNELFANGELNVGPAGNNDRQAGAP